MNTEQEISKEKLLSEIKELISKSENININENYLQYFELEDLKDMKKDLLFRKEEAKNNSRDFLDEIFEKTKK